MMQDFNNDMGMGGQFQNGQPNQFMTMNMSQEFLPNSQPQNNVPVSAPASRAEGGYQMNQTAPPTNQLLESFQVHTPPPTRGSSVKRRSIRTHDVVFGTPSTIATKRFQTPQKGTQDTGMGHGSMSVPQPNFSNGGFYMADMGPTTAPLVPQHPDFAWNMPTSTHAQPPTMHALDDPFSFQPQPKPQHSPVKSRPSGPRPQPSMHQRSQSALPQNMRPMDGPQFQAPYHHRTTSAGVNPSLVYSSPVTHRPSPPKQMRPSSRASMTEVERRFPYEHQLQESKREMDNMRSKRSRQQQFPPRTDSLGALPNIPSRPGVSRSNTIDGSRPMSLHVDTDIASMLSRSNTTASIPRKSSPLKRTNTRTSLSSISETPQPRYPRTSVFLTVDANGTARTETRVIDESPTKSVKQRSPTGSVKQKYPNLWDDSDSESDTNSEANRDAFTFPNRHERSSKMARLDPSLENLEGLKLPRSNSSASLRTPSKAAISAAAQLRRQNSARKSRPTRFNSQSGRRDTLASLNGSFVDLASMNIEDDRSPNGDAGNAIRGLVESRSFSQGNTSPHSVTISTRIPV